MLAHRMAVRLSFSTVLLWTIVFSRAVAAAGFYNLSSETMTYIPACARDCFISFLSVNYGPSVCGTNPTLQCLCSREGVSGFTVGEGAVQCIVAENSIGFCQGYDSNCKLGLVHEAARGRVRVRGF